MQDLASLKDFIVIVGALFAVLTSVCTIVCTYAITNFKVAQLNKVVFGNGKAGLVEIVEEMRIHCAQMHGVEVAEARARRG